MTEEIDSRGSFRFYPHQLSHANPTQPGNPKEYWIILKNKTPVPYAQTHLNIHQLANNNSLLETKVAEMEKEILNMKSKMEEMVQDVARLQYNNETMSMQLTGAAGRRRSDSHSTTESEAESFVNSFENILRMAEEQGGVHRDENGFYEEHIRQQMYSCASYDDDNDNDNDNDGREREEDLVYDSDGEASPRGRIVKKDANNNTYYQYEMLDVDGYNNGDVAPRGWKVSIEEEFVETCSECGFKGKLMAYGWRHADDNLCQDCVNLPGMEKYEC
jgi:regulator of replication initiation timing